MKIYRSAVIGCGRIGAEFDADPKRKYVSTHAGAYLNNKTTVLVAVSDLDRAKLEKCARRWGIRSLYRNYRVMLAKEKIDILSICTPPGTHYHILKEAVKFPLKAIFCEKPLSDNLVDAEKMLQLCKRKRVILQVDHQRRFDPLHICLKDYLADKISGQIQQVNFYYTAGIKNTGSHMFDLLRFFFGEVDWMEAFFSRNDSGRGDDPNLDGILKFHNGILGVFQACNAKKYLIFELDCFLEAGKFSLKNSGFSLDFYRAGKSKYFSGYRELSEAKSPFKTNYKRNFMANAVRHLADCVRMGRESNSSGRDGLAALKLIDAAIWSAKNNGKRIFIR